jgi:hypothetical protein
MHLHQHIGHACQLGDGPHFRKILTYLIRPKLKRSAFFISLLCLLLAPIRLAAQDAVPADTCRQLPDDSLAQVARQPQPEMPAAKPTLWQAFLDKAYAVVKEFNRIDRNYITPQKYNYALMLQGTHTYERYTLRSNSGQTFTFAPKPSIKVGPYFGWRWIFLGWQVDVKSLRSDTRREFDLSLYSSHIGIDIFSRQTGKGYHIKSAYKGNDDYTKMLHGMDFDGIEVGIRGYNLYYIFNHKKFSYPAAFSQSTMQKRSAGSALMGIGYTHHKIKLNHDRLRSMVARQTNNEVLVDSSFNFNEVNYTDASISGGYAYNYAFAPNWLFAASLSAALGYKRSKAKVDRDLFNLPFRGFNFQNLNIDGVGRFGLVWNNMRWFAGTSVILHTYNYNKGKFSTNNTFGSFNVYAGLNFGERHSKHKKKKRQP